MTRLKEHALTALFVISALAALGLFASVGLAVLGVLALVGLAGAAAAWIATAFASTSRTADA